VLRARDAIGEPRERQRLHPDAPGPGHHREEQPFPALALQPAEQAAFHSRVHVDPIGARMSSPMI